MGGFFSAPLKTDTATQTVDVNKIAKCWGRSSLRSKLNRQTSQLQSAADLPEEIREFSSVQIKAMIELYKEKQNAIDRSSIKGSVTARKDQYNALSKNMFPDQTDRPKLDPDSLHRRNHPKGYLTKITNDYIAQHDEELSVSKGIMVKVLRNHRDGRYEIYTAGGFGLVPGKVLAYVQYEPDY